MTIIVMGVSGSGKTTIGIALARELGWRFVDGDDLHPAVNVARMSRGEPLSDADRVPWLDAIRSVIVRARSHGESLVIACSALKAGYRRQLAAGDREVTFVYLDASPAVLEHRLASRTGHFAGPNLLASQVAALEAPSPEEAVIVQADQPVQAVVAEIQRRLAPEL